MKNYSQILKNVPQTQPIFGRTDMIKNSAGGYGFSLSDKEMLERFLLIGTENGTFYATEQELTLKNATSILNFIKKDPLTVAQTVHTFAKENRAVKTSPLLFVTALILKHSDSELARSYIYSNLPYIAKTSTDLFNLLNNLKSLGSKLGSSGLKRALNKWYTGKTVDQIAYQVTKYRQRNGWTHRDVLRLAHIKPTEDNTRILGYAVGKVKPEDSGSKLVIAFEQAIQEQDTKKLISLIQENNLTWEMIPTEKLNEASVLESLLPKMNLMALIRNLNRFTNAGLFDNRLLETSKLAVSKLTSDENISKAKVHPIFVLNALRTYNNGRGAKGKLTWNPQSQISSALETTFEKSFSVITPTNLNILVAIDVSGSMQYSNIAGLEMKPSEAAAALALTRVKTEPAYNLMAFDTKAYVVNCEASKTKYSDMLTVSNKGGGGTDCSLPFQYALAQAKKGIIFDVIEVYTDSETWAGNQHAVTYIETYRSLYNKHVKVVEVCMQSAPTSILPQDPNFLRVVGLDASVPTLINEFIKKK